MKDDTLRMEKLGSWAAVWSATHFRRAVVLLSASSLVLLAFAPVMPGHESFVTQMVGLLD